MKFQQRLCLATALFALAAPFVAAQEYIYTSNFGDGTVSGFALNQTTGVATPVPGSPFAAGVGPLPLAHSRGGHFLFVALTEQYLGGPCGSNYAQLVSYQIDRPTGTLTQIQDVTIPEYCPTSAIMDPSGKFVYVGMVDFGDVKVGAIAAYATTSGSLNPVAGSPFLSPIQVSPGQNPAIGGLAFKKDGTVLYASDPSDGAGILIFDRDANSGALTFRTAYDSGSPFSAIAVTPSGKFLLALPVYENAVYEYSIGADGSLTPVAGSPFALPTTNLDTDLAMSPHGKFMAVSQVGGITVAQENASTGNVTVVPGSPFGDGLPPALTFDPSAKYVITTGSVFAIDQKTGALTPVSTFTAGNAAEGVTAVHPCDFADEKGETGKENECSEP